MNPSCSLTGAQAAVLILTQSVSGQTSDELIASFHPEERGRVRQIIRLLEHRGLLIRQTEEDDLFVFPRTWHPTWDGRIALLKWAAYLGNIRLAGQEYSGINRFPDSHRTGRPSSLYIRMLTFLLVTVAGWFLFPWLFALLKWGIVLAFGLIMAGLLLWFYLC